MPVGSCSARVSSLARFLFVHSKQSESATIIGVRCQSGMFIGCCACNMKCDPLLQSESPFAKVLGVILLGWNGCKLKWL